MSVWQVSEQLCQERIEQLELQQRPSEVSFPACISMPSEVALAPEADLNCSHLFALLISSLFNSPSVLSVQRMYLPSSKLLNADVVA